MWSYDKEEIDKKTRKYYLSEAGKTISFKRFIELMTSSSDFIIFFNNLLKDSEFEAFFWEVKPVTINQISQNFEFVLVKSNMLSKVKADYSAFSEHFDNQSHVVSFPNLRKDAQLIVPTKESASDVYCHLASFVRNAPKKQIEAFWFKVAKGYKGLLGEKPMWLSTAGLGVYWLHVRVDSRPKYYKFSDYKLSV